MLIYNASQKKPCKDTTFSRFTAIKKGNNCKHIIPNEGLCRHHHLYGCM